MCVAWNRLKDMAVVGLAAVLLAAAGCEDDDAVSLAQGHDFGDQAPQVIVCLGDSITAGSGLSSEEAYPHQLALMTGMTVFNEGRDKELSQGGANRVAGVLQRHRPGYLFVLYGSNDVLYDRPAAGVVSALARMVQAARTKNTIPLLATLPPQPARQDAVDAVNAEIRHLARSEGVALVDVAQELGNGSGTLFQDGLHPNATGARLIARACANRL